MEQGAEREQPMPHSKGSLASMTPEERRRISSLGGKAAHAKGTAHRWSRDEARAMGRIGGLMNRGVCKRKKQLAPQQPAPSWVPRARDPQERKRS